MNISQYRNLGSTVLPYRKVIEKPPLIPMPTELLSLGDHIRTARVKRGLLQKDIATLFGVTESSITNWEVGRSEPDICYFPSIFAFLGYYPFAHETDSINGKFLQWRRASGLGLQVFARQYEVDYRTAVKWERAKWTPHGAWPERILALWSELPDYVKQHNSAYENLQTFPT